MKNVWKSIASLTCIAVVCTALLIVGNKFLPRQVRTFEYGEYLADEQAQFEELTVADLSVDPALKVGITAVFRSVSSVSKGGVVVKSTGVSAFDNTEIEMITGVSKDGKIVKVGYVGVVGTAGGSFYNYPLKSENFDRFVGKDPLALDAKKDFDTSGATLTTNAMLDAVRAAYKLGLALTGGVIPDDKDPVIAAVEPYFVQKVVKAAVSPESTDKIKIYDVELEDGLLANVFVDANDYFRFNVTETEDNGFGSTQSGTLAPDDIVVSEDGTFYATEIGIGVYRDAEGVARYAGIKSSGTYEGSSYFSVNQNALQGKSFGTVYVSDFPITGTTGDVDLNGLISGATASGVNAAMNVNKMYNDYMRDYVTRDTSDKRLLASSSTLADGDWILSARTTTDGKVTALVGETKLGKTAARFEITGTYRFDFSHTDVGAIRPSDTEASMTINRIAISVYDGKYGTAELGRADGDYSSGFFALGNAALLEGVPFGTVGIDAYPDMTDPNGTIVNDPSFSGATGTGLAFIHVLNENVPSMRRILAGGNV